MEVEADILNAIPQYDLLRELESPLSIEEIRIGIAQLKNNRAPGQDGIRSEIYKALMYESLSNQRGKKLYHRTSATPQSSTSFRKETRQISETTGVEPYLRGGGVNFILTRVLANRLLPIIEKILPEA